MTDTHTESINVQTLAKDIKTWGKQLGFQEIGITDIDLSDYQQHLKTWLDKNYHGEMHYMSDRQALRLQPDALVPNTQRVITARMNYHPPQAPHAEHRNDANNGIISIYALGRDYHKLIRKRLQQLARKITDTVGSFGYRAFTDSAPVLEKPLAEKSGLGWIGKHTNLINRQAGSWFFLGELFTDLPLPVDEPTTAHCGTCHACLDICPTQAIVAPYQLDARRCISYLTIELRGSIPEELRPLIGNRIYGCDDCQLVCPWNRFAKITDEKDFHARHDLDKQTLIQLFSWTEEEFNQKTQGSAIRRIGYECWLRNVAVGLGNAPKSPDILAALEARRHHSSELVREHVNWAIERQTTSPSFQ